MTKFVDIHEVAEVAREYLAFVWRLRQVENLEQLSFPQMSLLARLDRSGPRTPVELARTELVSPQAVVQTLAVLERTGLVRRRPDPGDGRRVLISVTRPESETSVSSATPVPI